MDVECEVLRCGKDLRQVAVTSGFRENSGRVDVSEVVTVFGLVTQSQGRERTLGTRLVQCIVIALSYRRVFDESAAIALSF